MEQDERLTYLENKLKDFPKVPFSLLPTPCHRLHCLSAEYNVEVYCKREDLSGFGFGGNKSRKLEILLGEALRRDCNTLVATGGSQSNFCRMAAAAGAAAGLEVHLVLGGDPAPKAAGNLVLDKLLGAYTHCIESSDWNDWEIESASVAEELREKGRKLYHIPIGGSVPIGVLGYVPAFLEILKEEARLGQCFDHIIHASGSGGTQAGLIVGKEMTGWNGSVRGISVAMDKNVLEEKVLKLSQDAAVLIGGEVGRAAVSVDDGFVGPGYAVRTPEADRALEYFAKYEGIFLDPVYTAKAAAALMTRLEQDEFSNQRVLFIHTGGEPALFAEI
jgi:D-cysteine desulfhydrase family pyridoxal phosphate-dependent enzyme